MRVRIKRQETASSKPYWQEFNYDREDDKTVVGMLDDINGREIIKDVGGNVTSRIEWECSCMQGMCGACAMVINNKPALACEYFLRDVKGDTLTIEPLKVFPTVADLVVDRDIILESFKKENVYIEEFKGTESEEYENMYLAGKCLKCGLCLEVCPNYNRGRKFYGAAFANDCYLVKSRSKTNGDSIKKSYRKHFENYCSKSLSCADVCPVNITTLASIARMNRTH